MSRFGRDYLQVGIFTDTLRKNSVRLIALNDAVDTAKGDDEFTAMYAQLRLLVYAASTFTSLLLR